MFVSASLDTLFPTQIPFSKNKDFSPRYYNVSNQTSKLASSVANSFMPMERYTMLVLFDFVCKLTFLGVSFALGKCPSNTPDWWYDVSDGNNCPLPYYRYQGK